MASQAIRTSLTHPLQIAEVATPGNGTVGVTFCPGKHQAYAVTGAWARDLLIDLQAIRDWSAGVFITLVTAQELNELKVDHLGAHTQALGMHWLHLPITDVSTPDEAWLLSWERARSIIHAQLDGGGRVLVHCKGGLGRAGTVAALILSERGMRPSAAIAAVRAARPGALETIAQEQFVQAHEPRWPSVRAS